MENSSSSKTRSPARVLAALLAVVMLFIVMPVLPAGAEKVTLSSITFLDAKHDPTDEDDIFFNPENDEQFLNNVPAEQEEATDLTWAGTSDLQAQRPKEKTNSVKLTLKSGKQFTSGTFGSKTFTFALYTGKGNPVVYWSTMEDGSNGTPLTSKGTVEQDGKVCNVYVLPQDGITESDIYITVKAGSPEKPTYTATFSLGDDVKVQAGVGEGQLTDVYDLDTVNVKEDETLRFKVNDIPAGYEPKISVSGGLPATPDEMKADEYTVKGFKKNFTVTVTLVKKQYTVTMPASGSTFNVNKKTTAVNHGDSFEFTVTLTDESHEAPNVEIKKKADRKPLDKNQYNVSTNGLVSTYSIFSVTEDLDITITDGTVKKHTVTIASGEGFEVTPSTTEPIEHGKEFPFTVKAKAGWKTTTPVVMANGMPLIGTKQDGGWKYTCTITADTTISVSGFEREVYTVTIKNAKEYTVDGSYNVSVPFEGDYTFTLTLADAYKATAEDGSITAIFTKGTDAEDVTVVKSEGRDGSYTVTVKSVKKSFTLSFGGIEQKTYEVKIEDVNGGEAIGYSVAKTGEFNSVKHGDGVSFTITPKDGYKIDNVSIYVTDGNGAALAGVMADNGKGTYSISSVTNNYTVKVSVSAIPFVITIQSSPATTLGDDESPMNSTVVTKRYTAADKDVTITHDAANGAYKFTLPKATRPGYKLVGWNNNDGTEIEKDTLTFYEGTAYTATVIAEWKINTALGEEGATPFVQLHLERSYGDQKDVLKVSHTASNIDPDDVGETVTLLSHGIIYGLTENALSNFAKLVEEGKITFANFNTDSSADLTKLDVEGLDSVYYSSHDDDGKNTGDMLKDGHSFTESVKNPEQLQGSAAGYMIVKIGDETYLFYSNIEKWADKK